MKSIPSVPGAGDQEPGAADPAETKRKPPRKKPGWGTGPRKIDGIKLDVRTAATFLGITEKTLRGQVARRLVPFRRQNARIIFIRRELEEFHVALPGCTLTEALQNVHARQGNDDGGSVQSVH